MSGHTRVVYPLSLRVQASEVPKNGHNLLRQQLQSQRVISTDPVFWEDEPAVILVGDGSHATIADADIVVTLYKECAGRTSQPPRWLPLLSCVRPPDFGSSASEPQVAAFPPLPSCSQACSLSLALQDVLASARLCKTFSADIPGGGRLQVTASIGQQARGSLRLSLQQTQGRPWFTDHERRPVYEVFSLPGKAGLQNVHLPGMPLTPLKETAPAPSHDVAEPDSPTTSGEQHSQLQFELRRSKGQEPVAQCTLHDDNFEIEMLEDGKHHLWGCVHLPLPQQGQAIGEIFQDVLLDLAPQASSPSLCLARTADDRLPLQAGHGERALSQPVAWSLLPRAQSTGLVGSISRSPFVARLRLPKFCSGFERHAFAPCDPQTLSFSAASGYVLEPQLQLLSTTERSPSQLHSSAGPAQSAGLPNAQQGGEAGSGTSAGGRLREIPGQTTRIALWPFHKSASSAWQTFSSPGGLSGISEDTASAPDAIRAVPPAGPGVGEMRRSSRSMRRTDSLAYEQQPCEMALDIAPQQLSEGPAIACLAFLLHAYTEQCQQIYAGQQQ